MTSSTSKTFIQLQLVMLSGSYVEVVMASYSAVPRRTTLFTVVRWPWGEFDWRVM